MPKFKYKAPDGTPFEIESASQVEADDIVERYVVPDFERNKGMKPPAAPPPGQLAPQHQVDAQGIPIDPRVYALPKALGAKERLKDKSIVEQIQGGIGHGIDKAALGIKGLLSNLSPDDERRLAQGREFVENTGPASSGGQIMGELAATGVPAAGVANATGRVLTRAVPQLANLAAKGRGAFNVGTAGNVGLQGAIQGGTLAPEPGEHRGQNAAIGGLIGAVAPAAVRTAAAPVMAAGRGVRGAFSSVMPTQGGAERGAYSLFEKNIGGREGVDTAVRNVRGAGESMLPKSTAALAGSPAAEAMEAGARRRLNVDWASHDDNVGYLAWRELSHSPDGLPPSEAMEALLSRFKRNGVPQGKIAGRNLEPELQEPFVDAAQLRAQLGKASNGMRDSEIAHVRQIAHELGQFEGARSAAGKPQVDMGDEKSLVSAAMAVVSGAMDSTKIWKARAAYNALNSGSARNKVIDEALMDPQKFVALAEKIQAKIDARKELTGAERVLQQVLMGARRQTGE